MSKKREHVAYSYWLNSNGTLSIGHGTNNEVGLTKEEYNDLVGKSVQDRVDFYGNKFIAPVKLEVEE